jgi:hypothetical protein
VQDADHNTDHTDVHKRPSASLSVLLHGTICVGLFLHHDQSQNPRIPFRESDLHIPAENILHRILQLCLSSGPFQQALFHFQKA